MFIAFVVIVLKFCDSVEDWPVSPVVKTLLSVVKSGVRIPGRSNRKQCRRRLATAATFLRSCVAQALSRRDGARQSLHASAQKREYNEDLIFDFDSVDFLF